MREVCELAAVAYGLTSLRAATAPDNRASQAVLTRAGFVPSGEVDVGGVHELRLSEIRRSTGRLRQLTDEFRDFGKSDPQGPLGD